MRGVMRSLCWRTRHGEGRAATSAVCPSSPRSFLISIFLTQRRRGRGEDSEIEWRRLGPKRGQGALADERSERPNHVGIEKAAGALGDFADGLLQRPGLLVDAFAG